MRAAAMAASQPAWPAPTTTTSNCSVNGGIWRKRIPLAWAVHILPSGDGPQSGFRRRMCRAYAGGVFYENLSVPTWAAFLFHAFMAMFVSMVVGLYPEAIFERMYYSSWLGALMPACMVIAAVLGYLLTARLGHAAARWVWLAGLVWLLVGVRELTKDWSPSWSIEKNVWLYAIHSLIGPKCGDSECLSE